MRLWCRCGVARWGASCVSRREGLRRRSGNDPAAMRDDDRPFDDDRSLRDFRRIADKKAMQAQALGEATAAVAKRLRMRRFTWVRAENAVYDDKCWRLVARMAGAPLHLVEAMVLRLDLYASANRPRGSVEGFSIAALAAYWAMPNDDVLARIYAAFEHPDIGWIDQDHVVTFWDRNPDTEDTTAADRTHRSKAFKKAMKTLGGYKFHGHLSEPQYAERVRELFALREETRRGHFPRGELVRRLDLLLNLSPVIEAHVVSTVSTVSLTARSDQNITQSGDAVDNGAAAPGGEAQKLSEGQADAAPSSPQNEEHAQEWLDKEGGRLVVERMNVRPTRAATLIERWLRQVNQSHADLAAILRSAAAPGLKGELRTGAAFHVLVSDECGRRRRVIEEGPRFAMGPAGRPQQNPAAAQQDAPPMQQVRDGDSSRDKAPPRKAVGQ